MKILVFTSLYPNNIWPHHGVFVKERITQVARQERCDVKVVAPVPYFPALKINHRWRFSQVNRHEVRDGLDVYHPRYVMIPKVGMALHGWLMFLSVLPMLSKLHRDFDFDLIDAHYVYPDGFAAALLGRYFKKPVVMSARGSDINLFKKFPLIRRLLRFTLRRADGVIAVSQALKDAMLQLGVFEGTVAVIPNGVDATKFFPLPQAEARCRLGLPNQRIILSVGHLTPNKGFDLVMRALKRLLDADHARPLLLVIVGAGTFRKDLEELIGALHLRDHVRLVGEVAHEQLHLWYSAADLFCLASGREGWPNVLLESLSCGTPVVATAVGGIPEIIRSDDIGLLMERNERDIAAKIALALHKTWQREAIVRYARKHTWERVAHAVLRVFTSVLETQKRSSYGQGTPARTVVSTTTHH